MCGWVCVWLSARSLLGDLRLTGLFWLAHLCRRSYSNESHVKAFKVWPAAGETHCWDLPFESLKLHFPTFFNFSLFCHNIDTHALPVHVRSYCKSPREFMLSPVLFCVHQECDTDFKDVASPATSSTLFIKLCKSKQCFSKHCPRDNDKAVKALLFKMTHK